LVAWRAVRAALEASLVSNCRALPRRRATCGCFAEARRSKAGSPKLGAPTGRTVTRGRCLAAAIVQDQFAATTRPHLGVTVMTIHKAKGKEFEAVIVFEGVYQRFPSSAAETQSQPLQSPRGGDARQDRSYVYDTRAKSVSAASVMSPTAFLVQITARNNEPYPSRRGRPLRSHLAANSDALETDWTRGS